MNKTMHLLTINDDIFCHDNQDTTDFDPYQNSYSDMQTRPDMVNYCQECGRKFIETECKNKHFCCAGCENGY